MTVAVRESTAKVTPTQLVISLHRGGASVVDDLADEWRGLCARSRDDQPFYRPEWIRAYLRAFMPDAKVLIIAGKIGGQLCSLLTLVEERGFVGGVRVRKLRTPVGTHALRCDAVTASGADGEAAISATWEFLQKLPGWDVLEFRDTPAGSTISCLVEKAAESGFHTVQVPGRPNPYISVPTDPELLSKLPLNARLRTKLRQIRRQLAGQESLWFYRVETHNRHQLERFFELEARGWKGQEGSAIACRLKTQQFYDEIAEAAARFGYFSLYMLELNGQLLAAHFSLTYQDRCYSPKVAYDEKFKEFAPGHLIVSEILRDCAKRGIHVYDITGPDDEWKMKWTSEARPVDHHFVFRGTGGNLARLVRYRVAPALRRFLQGRRASAANVANTR